MRVSEHVEQLLRQGRKPKELIELGFSKTVVTRVRRQLLEGKPVPQSRTQKGSTVETTLVQPRPGSLEGTVHHLESRVEVLEEIIAGLVDMETRLDGTPDLGLKHHFRCGCGASGFVALHIQCTKCGKETWWGWFPKE